MFIKRYIPPTVLLVFLFAIAFGCSDSGDSPTGSGGGTTQPVSFANDVRSIFVNSCARTDCHGGGAIKGGFNMGAATWDDIRNGSGIHGPVVVPGNALTSNLYLKTTQNFPFGQRMPQDGPPFLSIQQQLLIRDWINQGALDN